MSYETWAAEFYPKPASETTEDEAIEHSLKKWKGLTKVNLRRHGLAQDKSNIVDKNGLSLLQIASNSCAACHHYYDADGDCTRCPLTELRSGYRCDDPTMEEELSPYSEFVRNGNPRPMIDLLKSAKKLKEKKSNECDNAGPLASPVTLDTDGSRRDCGRGS